MRAQAGGSAGVACACPRDAQIVIKLAGRFKRLTLAFVGTKSRGALFGLFVTRMHFDFSCPLGKCLFL